MPAFEKRTLTAPLDSMTSSPHKRSSHDSRNDSWRMARETSSPPHAQSKQAERDERKRRKDGDEGERSGDEEKKEKKKKHKKEKRRWVFVWW